ncbi:protein of unknown function [Burkholderia multivorans]
MVLPEEIVYRLHDVPRSIDVVHGRRRSCARARRVRPFGHPRAARRAECRKDGARQRRVGEPPFGMPLHRKREGPRAWHADRFDQPVGRGRLDGKPRAEPGDPLVVQRIDGGLARTVRNPLQQAARRETHDMRGSVLPLERIGKRFAVVAEARGRMELLVQRAAVDDVHLLHAAADRQHRHAGVDRRAHQRQRGRVARRIVQRAGRARRPAVALRLDVRMAAGEQQPVDRGQDPLDALARAERGQHEREHARAVDERGEVLLAGRVNRMPAVHRAVGGHGDDRVRNHDRASGTTRTHAGVPGGIVTARMQAHRDACDRRRARIAWTRGGTPRASRCGRSRGPESAERVQLGQQRRAAVALERAERARGDEVEAAQAATGHDDETGLAWADGPRISATVPDGTGTTRRARRRTSRPAYRRACGFHDRTRLTV